MVGVWKTASPLNGIVDVSFNLSSRVGNAKAALPVERRGYVVDGEGVIHAVVCDAGGRDVQNLGWKEKPTAHHFRC